MLGKMLFLGVLCLVASTVALPLISDPDVPNEVTDVNKDTKPEPPSPPQKVPAASDENKSESGSSEDESAEKKSKGKGDDKDKTSHENKENEGSKSGESKESKEDNKDSKEKNEGKKNSNEKNKDSKEKSDEIKGDKDKKPNASHPDGSKIPDSKDEGKQENWGGLDNKGGQGPISYPVIIEWKVPTSPFSNNLWGWPRPHPTFSWPNQWFNRPRGLVYPNFMNKYI